MSFNLRNIREISNEPSSKFLSHLAKKVSDFLTKDQTEKLEGKYDVYSAGQDVDSVIKFHSLNYNKTFDIDTVYYPPFEPDADKLRFWIRGTNLGNQLTEYSMLGGRVPELWGDPILVDGGPFDDGISTGDTKSIALRFNRHPDPSDYIQVLLTGTGITSLNVAGTSTGKSYFIRFRVSDLSEKNGMARTLFEKCDDATPNDGAMLTISDTGRLRIVIKVGGTEVKYHTTNACIAVNTVYDVWVTWATSGNAIHIYVNNVDQALTVNADTINWHPDRTNLDFNIFRRGVGTAGGLVEGDLYDFRVYNVKVVSATEVGYMWTNKWTIYDIPFGQVMITDYYTAYEAGQAGFTSTGFTSTGFTT